MRYWCRRIKMFQRTFKDSSGGGQGCDGFRFVQTRSTALERSVRKLKARSGVELHRKAFLNAAGVHFI